MGVVQRAIATFQRATAAPGRFVEWVQHRWGENGLWGLLAIFAVFCFLLDLWIRSQPPAFIVTPDGYIIPGR